MIGGVIFDFDGVIVDSHPVHLQAWKAFLLSEDKAVSNAELSFVLEGATREDILAHFFGDLTKEQIRRYGEGKDQLFLARANEIRLIRGFVEFLAQLDAAGIPSAVATSGSRRRVKQALQAFNLVSRFRSVLTADDVSRGKPDPALFLLSAQALQLNPGQILVCEDAVAGVIAAKTAGMKCIGIAANGRGSLLKQAGSDLVVDDFRYTNFDEVSRLFT
ncbi:MAG TPA: HAD family phosphatase [Candidatus Angelobacter sp.]|jgi:HAD superfamily hydrolase (TIGR01509 family)|nr:HAD family phosphatase [Candidatus Angelobacter sp.]